MSIKTTSASLITLALTAISLSAHAVSDRLSAGMGHDLAQMACTSCHLIEPGQKNPPDHVGGPSFQEVANREGITGAKLREHLRTTHSNSMIPLSMPNPHLSDDQQNKIVDYILSLKSTGKH
jgi:cytochrome c551/c552